jgi:hypothetical protein
MDQDASCGISGPSFASTGFCMLCVASNNSARHRLSTAYLMAEGTTQNLNAISSNRYKRSPLPTRRIRDPDVYAPADAAQIGHLIEIQTQPGTDMVMLSHLLAGSQGFTLVYSVKCSMNWRIEHNWCMYDVALIENVFNDPTLSLYR